MEGVKKITKGFARVLLVEGCILPGGALGEAGETHVVSSQLASDLIHSRKAVVAPEENEEDPTDLSTPPGVVENRDPVPSSKKGK